MAEPHSVLNGLSESAAAEALRRCCGSERWVAELLAGRPYASSAELQGFAERIWRGLGPEDYLEAFAQHPQIGEDLPALRQRFASTSALSEREQAAVSGADEQTLGELRDANRAYRARFHHIFIVCASGKSARQILQLLEQRLGNDPADELAIAAAEQAKITRLRLQRLGAE
jgi:2-oxo-4-hydroxy-4-carboxy-5-ureidoimidazoline decarboxylase